MLEAEHISGGYDGRRIINDLTFTVKKGEIFGILGPNGSGKTTLMNMLTRLHPSEDGIITLKGRRIEKYGSKQLAKIIAVLPQFIDQFFTYTVKEIVSLGRYPYQKGFFKQLDTDDEEAIGRAMKQTEVAEFAEKSVGSLSGGEKQRVYLAQALAQEPELILLDEPTNHLDISHQKQLLDGLKKWVEHEQLTVISIFHDLNLAALYCDRLLLLDKGKAVAIGAPKDILTERHVSEVYGTEVRQLFHPELPRPLMAVSPEKLESERKRIDLADLTIERLDEMIRIESPVEWKTFSSAVIGAGFSWKRCFVNRHVAPTYDCDHPVGEMKTWLVHHGMNVEDTVAMMTAVKLKNAVTRKMTGDAFSVLTIVTAGVGDAVDIARAGEHEADSPPVGTINGWIFVDGDLAEEAFVQAIMTATEAKVKALHDANVKDRLTGTFATGTSTDSLLAAATQRGTHFPYAGTGTELGKMIGRMIYECTAEAIGNGRRE